MLSGFECKKYRMECLHIIECDLERRMDAYKRLLEKSEAEIEFSELSDNGVPLDEVRFSEIQKVYVETYEAVLSLLEDTYL